MLGLSCVRLSSSAVKSPCGSCVHLRGGKVTSLSHGNRRVEACFKDYSI